MQQSCKYEKLLSSFVDNELNEKQEKELRLHLKNCSSCQRELEEIFQADTAVNNWPEIEPSDAFNRNFWKKIDALKEQKQSRRLWHTWFLNQRLITAGLSACLVIGLLIGIHDKTGMDIDIQPDELFMVEDIDLLKEYELISNLDLLEDWDAINEMEDLS